MPNDSQSQEPKKPEMENKKKTEETISLRSLRPNSTKPQTGDALVEYIKANTKDSIAYVLMIVGILFLLFDSVSAIGGLIVGVIFSLYFASELAFMVTHIKEFFEEYGLAKSLILGGTLLVLLIKAPFFFLGAAIVTAIKVFIWPEAKT